MTNDFICYHPWVGLDIGTQYDFRPCCKYDKIVANSLQDYLSSQELKQLRQDFLEGKKPAGCSRCWKDEDYGVESKRQRDWRHIFNYQVPKLDALKAISVPFGNICNLACRTCKSYASSKWALEEQKIKNNNIEIKIWPHNRYYAESWFSNELQNLSKDVELIEILGGEPFVTGTEEHLNYLDFLINHNAENITIHYTTNATIFPDTRFWSRWEKFKKIDIQLSIDGTEKVFEYTRYPGNWEDTYNNIKLYQEKQNKYKNIELSICHTISIFTVYYVDDFLKWCVNENLPKPFLGMLFRPDYYSVSALNNETKNYLKTRLINKHSQQVINYMYGEENQRLLTKTYDYITMIDNHRGQKFSKYLPEFYNVLKKTCSILGKLP